MVYSVNSIFLKNADPLHYFFAMIQKIIHLHDEGGDSAVPPAAPEPGDSDLFGIIAFGRIRHMGETP
jgi:hypothetical protein